MGQISSFKLLLLIVCLGLTGLLVHRPSTASVKSPSSNLKDAIGHLPGWQLGDAIPLSPRIVDELRLDDYLFQTFSNGQESVTLYVGYYHTAKKVGAAHDPMVCYPGQGWRLTQVQKGGYSVPGDTGADLVYSTMIAEQEGQKEFILYWFQADEKATANTLGQKFTLLKQKILSGGENNAFVRVSASLSNRSPQEAQALILSFLNKFYPAFLNYIKTSDLEANDA